MNIELKNGEICVIDDSDYNLVKGHSWYVQYGYYKGKKTGPTAVKSGGAERTILIHRLIMNAPKGIMVDHINGDVLNNCRSNLRLASHEQNLRNRKISSANKCGIKGIYQRNDKPGVWRAQIRFKNKKYNVGEFRSLEDAFKARDVLARELHGEFYRP